MGNVLVKNPLIVGGGEEAKLYSLSDTITNNTTTTYSPSTYGDYNGFSDVSITTDVSPNLTTKYIYDNGTYKASDEGYDGYSQVQVSMSKYTAQGSWNTVQYYGSSSTNQYEKYLGGGVNEDAYIDVGCQEIGSASCNRLDITSVHIPGTVSRISSFGFYRCKNLKLVDLSVSVREIGREAFLGCTSLQSIELPEELRIIGEAAFYGTDLRSIHIPQYVSSIGNNAFAYIPHLNSITVDPLNQYYYSVNNCLIRRSDNTLILACNSSIIPTDGSVMSFAEGAFSSCSELTSITIPSGINSISGYMFSECHNLANLVVDPNNSIYHSTDDCVIETSSNKLILGCKNSIIPTDGSVTSINDHAFDGRTGLTTISIPDTVTQIGNGAFSNTGITTFSIPNNLGTLAYGALGNCTSLQSIHIGDSLSYIGAQIGLTNLETITVSANNSSFRVVNNCLIDSNNYLVLGSNLSSIPSNENILQISEGAFHGRTGLTNIIIPSTVTTIEAGAFGNCTGLTSIIIPSSVTSLSSYSSYLGEAGAFQGCTGLETLDLSNSVCTIGRRCFAGCTSLTSVTIPAAVTLSGSYIFEGCTGLQTLIIESGNTTSLGMWVFSGCTSLSSITLPNTIYRIEREAFAQTAISSINLPSNLETLGYGVFQYCTNLTSIVIPDSVITMEGSVFYGCTHLTSVSLSKNIHSLDSWTFRGCHRLEAIVMPHDLTIINGCFSDCPSLQSITLSSATTTLGSYAINYCTHLPTITIPSTVTYIGQYAFRGCWALSSITFGGTMAEWNNISFGSNWQGEDTYISVVHCTDGDINL